MKDPIIVKITEELRPLLKDGDLSLATRLLLDFLTDITLSRDDFEEALAMRAKFNQIEDISDLALRREKKKEFEVQFHHFLDQLDGVGEGDQAPKKEGINPFRPRLKGEAAVGATSNKPIFKAEKLMKQYKNTPFRLGPLDIQMKAGELTGIVGENGNGKTTLLRIIAGDLSHSHGQIAYPHLGVGLNDWYRVKQHIAFIPQRLNKWQGLLKDNLHFSAANHGIKGKENDYMVDFIIHRLGLTKYKNARWSDISSGYKLRFELAKALVWHPRLLVLDEPLANLDINTKLLFMQDLRLIANIKKFPISIIFSSQQLHEVESVVDNILFLKAGTPIYSGAIKDFGNDREENSFEVSGDFTREQLLASLATLDQISVEDTGQSLIVHTDKSIDAGDLLMLLSKSVKVDYFRDISKSTRKLF